jgi:hypothetical protein
MKKKIRVSFDNGNDPYIAQQSIVKLKQLALSSIVMSHRNYVADVAFIPT